MGRVGPGVKEIRVRDATGAFRVMYLATQTMVFVLHGFVKKSQRTSEQDIWVARQRLKVILGKGYQ
jgi:phage-related protein